MVTAKGIVVPVEWDDEGIATEFAISTFDENEYWLESRMARKELLDLVQKEVRVTGDLRKKDGRKILAVHDLTPEP